MSIEIKMDIKTRNDEGKWGYWGKKTPAEELTLEDLLTRVEERDRSGLHEHLVGDKYRPYADVDAKCGENFEQTKGEILWAAKEIMERTFPEGNIEYVWDSSCEKKGKISGHFIMHDVYFTDKEHIRYLLNKECGGDMSKFHFDAKVYDTNHLMRLPFCRKPNDERVLRAATIHRVNGEVFFKYTELQDGKEVPMDLSEDLLAAGLITMVGRDDQEMPVPEGYVPKEKPKLQEINDDTFEVTPELQAARLERMKLLIQALGPNRATSRQDWRLGVIAIRNNAMKSKQIVPFRALAQEFAKKAEGGKYDETATDDLYLTGDAKLLVGFTFLKKWADADTPGWDIVQDWSIKAGQEFDIELLKEKIKLVSKVEHLPKFADALVEYMNRYYTFIKARKPFIIFETFRRSADGETLPDRDFQTKESMKDVFENKTLHYKLAGAKEAEALKPFDCWFKHPKRKEKNRIWMSPRAFEDPKYDDPRAYNMFNGLAITYADCKDASPLKEDCAWLQHIRKRWAQTNEALYNNVLDRFALQIQKPWVKHGVGLAMKSEEGGGKGIILQPIFRIVGKQYIAFPNNASQIFKNFNALMEGKLIVFADELTWGGDKEAESAWKRLVTELTTTLERKGIDPVTMDNQANVIACSNEDWYLPASRKARRLQALELLNELAGGKKELTTAIIKDIAQTDILSIAKFFYERDISNFDPTVIITTDALRSQKVESMKPLDTACLSILNHGTVKIGDKDMFISEAKIMKSDFYQAIGAPIKFMSDVKFWKKIRELFPSIKFPERETVNGRRGNYAVFPKLEVLQQDFRNMYDDQEWKFDDPELDDQPVPVHDDMTDA